MQQLASDLTNFWFNHEMFVPRGHCGQWNPTVKTIYILANWVILIAYLILGPALVLFRNHLCSLVNATPVRWSFGSFIASCGIGHMDQLLSFKYPMYHFFTILHVITALTSWWAVLSLFSMGLPGEEIEIHNSA